MKSSYTRSALACLLWFWIMPLNAAPASIAVATFSDDAQAQQSALNNDDFVATGPAGPRITNAVSQALTASGIPLVAADH